MPNVRVTCLLCEDPVEVPGRDVVLHREGSGERAVHRYGFTCPTCAVYVVRIATHAVVDALLASDAEVATSARPPWEAGGRPGTVLVDAGPPPLTEADVLLFRRALQDDATLAAWLGT